MANVKLVDPTKTAKYPVYLGQSVLSDSRKRLCTGIKYNHKPSQTTDIRRSIITQTGNVYNLSLDDSKDVRYEYTGHQSTDGHVLLFDPARQGFVLERMGADLDFNLSAAPWEADSKKLREQYAQLQGEDSDSNNPYDYRNFLEGKKVPQTPQRDDLADDEMETNFLSIEPERGLGINMQPKPKSKNVVREGRRSDVVRNRKLLRRASPEPADDGDFVIEMDPQPSRREDVGEDDDDLVIDMQPEPERGRKQKSTVHIEREQPRATLVEKTSNIVPGRKKNGQISASSKPRPSPPRLAQIPSQSRRRSVSTSSSSEPEEEAPDTMQIDLESSALTVDEETSEELALEAELEREMRNAEEEERRRKAIEEESEEE